MTATTISKDSKQQKKKSKKSAKLFFNYKTVAVKISHYFWHIYIKRKIIKGVVAYIEKKKHIFCNKIFTSLQEINHCNEIKNLLQAKRLKTVETVAIYNSRKDYPVIYKIETES